MKNAKEAADWMLSWLAKEGCIYQDDVVDFLIKEESGNLLRENTEGNLVLGNEVLKAFKSLTETNVVWVKSGRYWRFRVKEDGPAREARG